MKVGIIISWMVCLGFLARGQELQSVAGHHTGNDSMLIAASPEAALQFEKRFADWPFVVIPESREYPVALQDALPSRWMERRPSSLSSFRVQARPGEYLVFQLAVYAHKSSLKQIAIHYGDLRSGKSVIPRGSITCFNLGGINFQGKTFTKQVDLDKGNVQSFWMGVQVPSTAKGQYTGDFQVEASGHAGSREVHVILQVQGTVLADKGTDDASRLARLSWLNSTIAEDHGLVKGEVPLVRKGRKLQLLGRELLLAGNGLPAAINSYFIGCNDRLGRESRPILQTPMRFVIETEEGRIIRMEPGPLRFTEERADRIRWEVRNHSAFADLVCTGSLEADGFGDYQLRLEPKQKIAVKDIRLELDFSPGMAGYMMGLGAEGERMPDHWDWKWDVIHKHQDALWVGGVNGGLHIKFKDTNYIRPLVNIYYPFGPLQDPSSWSNGGAGGVHVGAAEGSPEGVVRMKAFSGARVLEPGRSLFFNFELLITPLKRYDKKVQYGDRYFHLGTDQSAPFISMADEAGANIINLHHKSDIYPFINYPFSAENIQPLSDFIRAAHSDHKRVKLYYTTRELTVNLPEFWAFRSLGGELIFPGPGNAARTNIHPNGPPKWLADNVKDHYIPAWLATFKDGKYKGMQDISVITTPDSRLNNFYLGGLDWMVKELKIDGIYVDDCAMDRTTIRRARKILDRQRPDPRIDMHSWNPFNEQGSWASCLNIYMDLLPYIDLVWIGEGRDYNRLPDHWLIEVSGIPFGLPGQMLDGGGNPWRGMVYGITNRAGWTDDQTQRYIWKIWDKYHFADKEMVGYWDADCPARSNNDSVQVTVYKGKDQAVIAVANWSKQDQDCSVRLDKGLLGFDPEQAVYLVPAIPGFQPARSLPQKLSDLRIPGGKGWLIVVDKTGK